MNKKSLKELIRKEVRKVLSETTQTNNTKGVRGYNAFVKNNSDIKGWEQWKLRQLEKLLHYDE